MNLKLWDFVAEGKYHGLILNFVTALGYMGGFPDPPKFFTELLSSYPILKWFLVTLLIYQGGGEQDFQLAIEITIFFYFVNYLLNRVEEKTFPEKEIAVAVAEEE